MKKIVILFTIFLSLSSNAGEFTLTGTVVSDGQKMIGSRFMGYVKHVYVKIGDKVQREDDLYEMESAEFDIMKMEADVMLQQARVMVEYWRDKLKSINTKRANIKRDYRNDNKIELQDMFDLDAQAANLDSMLKASQTLVKEANIRVKKLASIYSYIKMKAPSDGVVVKKNIKVGDMIMPGMLTIMLVDTEDLEVEVSISESIISKVRRGDKVKVKIPSLGYKTKGTIKAIIPDVNPMTHKIKMRIDFDRGDQDLILPGMYAKVTFKERKRVYEGDF